MLAQAPDDLLRPREAARLLGVTPVIVARWARAGVPKTCLRTAGGHRRYHRGGVQDFYATYHDAVRLLDQGWSILQVAARSARTDAEMRQIVTTRHLGPR